ncbi:putative prolyl 4-hydroxylase alpha subunit [Metschnikowia bicuspidata]|uniref:Putative prolyl 4-hydroxylase alpha subunit n=1 Tax=Metschnikowia bicuspidata TaxID=27322 RepID=A0A4P9ZEI9_9ASCO|nr:putative prolyl 4-hydroxylase alpha subunit [Metschnikowia bicuspidata]
MVRKQKPAAPTYTFPTRLLSLHSSAAKHYFKPRPALLLPGQFITIDHFFSDDLCDELIASFSVVKLETTPLIKSREYSLRVNDRVSLVDCAAADALWKYFQYVFLNPEELLDDDEVAIAKEFSAARSLNPQLRVYRYSAGHFFGKHYDESVECPIAAVPAQKGRTKWTLLIYLSGDTTLRGGATIFYPEGRGAAPLKVQPQKGTALLHKHGDDCLQHEGERVTAGEKWILRSDVTF